MAIQKSSGSTRERWVKALLPAAVIVALYMLVFNVTLNRKLRSLRSDLAAARTRAITDDAVASVFAEKSTAAKQVRDLQERIGQAKRGVDESLSVFTQGAPAERMMQIDDMCRELSIGLLNQKTTTNIQVSKVREQSLKTLRELASNEAITYRQLDLVAKYADMVSFLHRLPESVDGVVPLGIELLKLDGQPDAGRSLPPGQRIWRIYLLM